MGEWEMREDGLSSIQNWRERTSVAVIAVVSTPYSMNLLVPVHVVETQTFVSASVTGRAKTGRW
jgi:hypothetical protein